MRRTAIVLVLLAGCRASGSARGVALPSGAEPTAGEGRATPSRMGEGVVHGSGERFSVSESSAACGPAACGNGERDSCSVWPRYAEFRRLEPAAEVCDGNREGITCEDLGYAGGELRCSDDCSWDLSGCRACFDEQCTGYAVERRGEGGVMGIAFANHGSRVRLVWGTAELESSTWYNCLYTAWADEDRATLVTCDARVPLTNLELETSSEELVVRARSDSFVWSIRIDETGEATEPVLTESETRWPRASWQSFVELDGLQLHPVMAPAEVSLSVQWTDGAQALGEPIRVASDPHAEAQLLGAIAEGERVRVLWWSRDRGLFSASIARPPAQADSEPERPAQADAGAP